MLFHLRKQDKQKVDTNKIQGGPRVHKPKPFPLFCLNSQPLPLTKKANYSFSFPFYQLSTVEKKPASLLLLPPPFLAEPFNHC